MTFLLPSLLEYLEGAKQHTELYDVSRICAAAKHTFEGHLIAYNMAVEVVRNSPDLQNYDILLDRSEKILEVSNNILSTLRKGAEIGVLVGAKFDALQVVALISQLPDEIVSVIEETLFRITSDISSHIERTLDDCTFLTAEQRDSLRRKLLEHAYLRETKVFAIADATKHITDNLRKKLSDLTVPVKSNDDSLQLNPVDSQIIEMNDLVPRMPKADVS